jgi:hypothetical protein
MQERRKGDFVDADEMSAFLQKPLCYRAKERISAAEHLGSACRKCVVIQNVQKSKYSLKKFF